MLDPKTKHRMYALVSILPMTKPTSEFWAALRISMKIAKGAKEMSIANDTCNFNLELDLFHSGHLSTAPLRVELE